VEPSLDGVGEDALSCTRDGVSELFLVDGFRILDSLLESVMCEFDIPRVSARSLVNSSSSFMDVRVRSETSSYSSEDEPGLARFEAWARLNCAPPPDAFAGVEGSG
jgi:hypothetical protein